MCGRYVIKTSTPELARMFGVDAPAGGTDPTFIDPADREHVDISSFNVAPTQPVVVCRRSEGIGRILQRMRWGLIPGWSKDDRSGARMINARAETLAERPAFRNAFKRRRCLVPASGFFEWQRAGGSRQPYYFRLRSGAPFAFAGIWEGWSRPGGERVDSCAIVTTDANALVAPVHARMPVILSPGSYEAWLAVDDHPPDAVRDLLAPYPAEDMHAYPVSTFVNRPSNDDPRCIEPLGAALEPV